MTKDNNTGLGEKWLSQNAQKCIDKDELPIPCFNKANINRFLSNYLKAYPSNIEEYNLLCKVKLSDWKLIAKQHRCTSWHHYGSTAQRTGFWDLWALADKFLEMSKTKSGKYQYQLIADNVSKICNKSRKHINEIYSQGLVRLCIIKYLGKNGLVYAPCLLSEVQGKNRRQDVIFFDYVEVSDYIECSEPTILNPAEVKALQGFAITNTFRKYDDEVFAKFSKFKKSSFYKLLHYAKSHNIEISVVAEDTRPRLEYKGPPNLK